MRSSNSKSTRLCDVDYRVLRAIKTNESWRTISGIRSQRQYAAVSRRARWRAQQDLNRLAGLVGHWAAGKSGIYRLWFFGSRVKLLQRRESDLDVAVQIDNALFSPSDGSSGAWFAFLDLTAGWTIELSSLTQLAVQLEQFAPGETSNVGNYLAAASVLIWPPAAN